MSMNIRDEHPSVKNRDWRLQAITSLVEDWHSPSGVIHKAGTPVQAVGFVRYPNRNPLLTIPVPNPCAMYISYAFRVKSESEQLLQELNPSFIRNDIDIVPPEIEGKFFDCLECLISLVIFSYTALEVFANSSIPDNFQFTRERNDNKYSEIYTKNQIERNLSLTIKLDEVLPQIFSVSSPKGRRLWADFVWLRELRDRFIHLKSTDWEKSEPEMADKYVWTNLLSKKVLLTPHYALEMMSYFYNENKPRWLKKQLKKLSA